MDLKRLRSGELIFCVREKQLIRLGFACLLGLPLELICEADF
jgi:hypothetical protein